MIPLLFANMQGRRPPKIDIGAMPDVDPMQEMLGNFIYVAPALALTILGLLVLTYDFALLRKRPSAERQKRLGLMTLVGVLGTLAGQVWLMLPLRLYEVPARVWGLGGWQIGGFEVARNDVLMFAGTVHSDGVSTWMNLLVLGLLALVVILSLVWNFTEHWGEYFALMCWAGVGMMLLIMAEDLLTLFLTLETMTLCLYMAAAFEKSRRRSAEGGLKYFVYGSVSSALFLFGLSLIYGLTGTTRLGAIRTALEGGAGAAAIGLSGNLAGATAVLLLLVGFGFKIAAVPFHQWAPDAYEGAPAPVTAWIASGSKIASIIAMMKVLVGSLAPWAMRGTNATSPGWIGIIALISAITMTYGNFAALAQKNLKRMLAYSSIAHAGYMLVGILAASVSVSQFLTSAPVLFYLVIYSIATVGAFALAAWLVRDKGTDEIEDLNGLGYRAPVMGVCVVLLMLSLIGMPPLAGFMGKFYMFSEALNGAQRGRLPLTWLVMLGLFNSVVSAFYYVRVLKAMYLRDTSGPALNRPGTAVALPIFLSAAVSLAFGVYPAPLMDAMKAASSTRALPTAKYVTGADPTKITTEQERQELYQKKFEEFKANGGSAGMGGGARPKSKAGPGAGAEPTKREVTPPKNKAQGKNAPGAPETKKGASRP